MKKILSVIVLMLVLMCALASCNSSNSQQETSPEVTSTKVTTPEVTPPETTTPEETTTPKETTTPEETTTLEEVTTPEETTPAETTPSEIIYNLAPSDIYYDSEVVTNYVKMNVSYTDSDGQQYNGDIVVLLDAKNAPITVANFQKLVKQGFYNGLTFHRVVEDFVIQGGDPKGNGTGGSDEEIKGEFTANGVNNPIKHERGVISMARSGIHYNENGELDYGYDSATSQFFIMQDDYPHLDGLYAAFGYVVFGMRTVDGIGAVDTDYSDKPLIDVVINFAVFVSTTAEETTAPEGTTTPDKPPVGTSVGNTCPTISLDIVGSNEKFDVQKENAEGRVVVLNIWFTTCGYCIWELPSFYSVASSYADRVSVAAVHIEQPWVNVTDFIQNDSGHPEWNDGTMTIAWDTGSYCLDLFQIRACPVTIVIDANGVITDYFVGALTYNEIVTAVEKALGE